MARAASLASILRRADPKPDTAAGVRVLTQRRIYILPTSGGALFGMTLLVMLVGCINYNLGLGYVLTFLLTGIFLVCLLHTFRNLAQLQLQSGRTQPVFAGDTAVFPVVLANPSRLARFSVGLAMADPTEAEILGAQAPVWTDLAAGEQATAELRLQAAQRGRLHLPRLRVFSTFPLGLFHAWSYLDLDAHCIVYPRPEADQVPLPPALVGEREGLASAAGQDDFAGLRQYHPGDSLRHIAWKAVAREQSVLTKQFAGPAAGQLWLSWNDTPPLMRPEARISRLTRWVLEAGHAGLPFGLDVPGARFDPASGAVQEDRCLTALALLKVHG